MNINVNVTIVGSDVYVYSNNTFKPELQDVPTSEYSFPRSSGPENQLIILSKRD